MDKKIKISELPEFDATRHLEDEEDIAMYLTCVLEENDAALLAAALGDIAKARGMTEVAKKAGIDSSHAPAWECRVDAPASPGESVAASWTTEDSSKVSRSAEQNRTLERPESRSHAGAWERSIQG